MFRFILSVFLIASPAVAESGNEKKDPKRDNDHKLICVSSSRKESKNDSTVEEVKKCSLGVKSEPSERQTAGDARRS